MESGTQERQSPLRLGVLGSGSGTNLQAIFDAIDANRLKASVQVVLSDRADAYILERARRAGCAAYAVDCQPFKTKLDGAGEQTVLQHLRDAQVDYVVLAGFMRMVKAGLLEAFPHRIVNIHPSLLPAFPGLESWKQALEYGVKVAGCTVHFVDAGMDTGPILVQRSVPVHHHDTAESLHARIQEQEHIAFPEALQLIASGQTRISGRRVVLARPT